MSAPAPRPPLDDTARGLLHVVLYEAAATRDSCRDAAASPHLGDAAYREVNRQRSVEHDLAGRQLVVLCGCADYCAHLFPPADASSPAPGQLWYCPRLDLVRTVEQVDRMPGFTTFVEKDPPVASTRTDSLAKEWLFVGTAPELARGMLVRVWPWPEVYDRAAGWPELALPPGRTSGRRPAIVSGELLVRLARDFDVQLTRHSPRQTRREASQCPRPDYVALQLAPLFRGFGQR